MSRPVAVLLLVLCTMIWGFAFLAQKSGMETMGPWTFIGVRYLLGALLITPIAIVEFNRRRAEAGPFTRGRNWRIAGLSLAFVLGVWFQQHALLTASVTNGGFLTALYVVFTPFVAFLLLRLKPHPIIVLGAPLALVGIYLLTGASFTSFTIGDGELVLCAICWAVQVALLGDLVQETRMPVFLSVVTFWATAICGIVAAFAVEQPSLVGISGGWIEILYTGMFSTAIAFTLQAIGQQRVPPSNSAIILSSECLWAALGAAIVLGERLSLVGYVGAAMIFASIILVEAIPALHSRRPITVPGSG